MRNSLLFLFLLSLFFGCYNPENPPADVLLINGRVTTMDSSLPQASSIAIKGDRILAVGTEEQLLQAHRGSNTEILDLKGNFVMPGLIEGHGHFLSMGRGLSQLNLLHTRTWEEIIDSVQQRVSRAKPGEWIFGRGWHQEKWDPSPAHTHFGYPDHRDLSAVSPENPVLLLHASGHALMANQKALQLAGISKETPDPNGGAILRFDGGAPIGILEENAMHPIWEAFDHFIQSKTQEEKEQSLSRAIQNGSNHCLKWGITSFQDAGTSTSELLALRAHKEQLGIRLSVMLLGSPSELGPFLEEDPRTLLSEDVPCRAIKGYFDGALGSYGAWLLAPYSDKPKFYGQNTTPVDTLAALARLAVQHQLQLCVHAIGDRANREVLDLVQQLQEQGRLTGDHRWRIEHAQLIDTADIPRFGRLGVIASMQPIHCTSDAPFVVKRLDSARAAAIAYPWRTLLDHHTRMAIGTDVPVEEINPFVNIYAALTRRRLDNGMTLFPQQAMTRQEILKGYTLWNAYAAKQEKHVGSITPGKYADLVVLSNDLLNCEVEKILQTEVLYTLVGGKIAYRSIEK